MQSLDAATTAALLTSHASAGRLLALAPDYTVTQTWGPTGAVLLDAWATYERLRLPRRTGSAVLMNVDGALSPQQSGDTLFTGSLWRLERGVWAAGSWTWVTLATLVVSSFDVGMAGRLGIAGEDPTWLLQQQMGAELTLASGTSAEDAIRTLWEGYLPPGTTWTLDGAGRTLGTTRTWAETDDRLDAGVSLMTDLGLEVFADRLGGIVLRPASDPTTAPVSATITRLAGTGSILDLARRGDRLAYNRVVVISESPDSTVPVYRAEAEVTDTTSPIHSSRIGVRTAPIYRTSQSPDQAAVNAVAAAQLVAHSLVQDGVSGSFVPDARLDEGDVVTVSEDTSGTGASYVIDRVTHPVLEGAMTLETTRVVGLTA